MVTTPSRFGSRVDLTSPRSVATAEFTTARRGFDRDEVRALLDDVANELQRVRDENARLQTELDAARVAEPPELDEATLTSLLGEEAARVLATAKEGAGQIRAKAQDGADRLLRDAHDDAARLRKKAALDVARQRQDAAAEVETEIEAAKAEGRQMVAEARAVRERMLTDLARRRDAARAQLERLRLDRDRLVASFEEAGRSVDEVLAGLRDAVPDPIVIETVEEAVAAVVGPDIEPGAEAYVDDAAPAEEQPVAEPQTPVLTLVEDEPEPEVIESVDEDVDVATEVAVEVDDRDENEGAEAQVPFHLGEAPSLSYAGELDDEPERRSAVDDLFARLRSSGPAEVVADVELSGGVDEAEPQDAATDDGTVAEPAPLDGDAAYLAERAAALDPVQGAVARHLKRAITDEQNEVLDALRRLAAPQDLDALVGTPVEHAVRYRNALTADLRTAAAAGARSVGARRDVLSSELVTAVLDDVEREFVAPLRERLARALEDAGGDSVEASATVRAAYREWRAQRADEVAAHLVLLAHGRGAFDAVEPGTPIHWVVDPEGPLCPDADDNALGGVIAAGAEFPTGHCHAPAHPGCCCGIALTQG